jgi:hypothetical protein
MNAERIQSAHGGYVRGEKLREVLVKRGEKEMGKDMEGGKDENERSILRTYRLRFKFASTLAFPPCVIPIALTRSCCPLLHGETWRLRDSLGIDTWVLAIYTAISTE